MTTLALTRPVPGSFQECQLTHLERTPINLERALAQHAAYEDALRRVGCSIIRLPRRDDLPDSVFVEDTAIVFPDVAVVTYPGAPSRREEIVDVANYLRRYRRVEHIQPPGTMDGGDVLVIGKRVWVGLSSRTNEAAVEQLTSIVGPTGYTVETVKVVGTLHLKSMASALPGGRILADPRLPDLDCEGVIRTSETDGANVVTIGSSVIAARRFPATIALLRDAGHEVMVVEMDELAKAEGALTCCSIIIPTD